MNTIQTEKLTLSVEEVALLLGIGRNLAYEGVRRGDIPSIRIGKRIVVPRTALEKFLAGQDSPYKGGV